MLQGKRLKNQYKATNPLLIFLQNVSAAEGRCIESLSLWFFLGKQLGLHPAVDFINWSQRLHCL
jgi:hypothetical protein